MIKLLFIPIFILSLTNAGVVRPFTSFPIRMSSTNSGSKTDYNFTLQLDTYLPPGGTIEI
jgi:hypothetical protein